MEGGGLVLERQEAFGEQSLNSLSNLAFLPQFPGKVLRGISATAAQNSAWKVLELHSDFLARCMALWSLGVEFWGVDLSVCQVIQSQVW